MGQLIYPACSQWPSSISFNQLLNDLITAVDQLIYPACSQWPSSIPFNQLLNDLITAVDQLIYPACSQWPSSIPFYQLLNDLITAVDQLIYPACSQWPSSIPFSQLPNNPSAALFTLRCWTPSRIRVAAHWVLMWLYGNWPTMHLPGIYLSVNTQTARHDPNFDLENFFSSFWIHQKFP